MPAKLNRKIISEVNSEDGRFIFRFYDTGSLSVIDAKNPINRRTNTPNSFLRINNLVEPKDIKLLPRLYEILTEVASPDYNFSVEVFRQSTGDVVDAILRDKKLSARMKFAIFVAAVSDTRGVSLETIRAAAVANEDLLDFAYDKKLLKYFLRPDLGVSSMDFNKKVLSEEEFIERNAIIVARRNDAYFALVNERVNSGIVTSHIASQGLRADASVPSSYAATGIYGKMLLTAEENYEVASRVREKSRTEGYYAEEIQRLIPYVWLTKGPERALELIHFIHKFKKDESDSYYAYNTKHSLDKIDFPAGEVTEEVIIRALDNEDLPLEIAISIEV